VKGVLRDFVRSAAERVDAALDSYLPPAGSPPGRIYEAVRYSVFSGGKRFRPLLLLLSTRVVAGEDAMWREECLRAAAAVEMVHTYSLIHDDLPCMDDDQFRRGKPTNHVVFGEALALLAGDALLTMAFETLGGIEDAELSAALIRELAGAAGPAGMIGGQVLDMAGDAGRATAEELERIHSLKTGALIRASARMGGLVGGAEEAQLRALDEYATNLGLAFQITDDILDVVGDPAKTGKSRGSDERNRKATYPALFGLERSRELARRAVSRACGALREGGLYDELLVALAEYLLEREG